jgi:predicted transcriptional regulator
MTDGRPLVVHLPPERREALEALARTSHRDPVELVGEAVAEYLEAQAGWEAHLRERLRQAPAGEFASPGEVAKVLGRRV